MPGTTTRTTHGWEPKACRTTSVKCSAPPFSGVGGPPAANHLGGLSTPYLGWSKTSHTVGASNPPARMGIRFRQTQTPNTSPIIGLFAKEGMPGGCPALYCGRSDGSRRAIAGAAWYPALRSMPRCDDDVAAPQALPCAGRHVRPAACTHPRRDPPLRRGVQPPRRTVSPRRAVPSVADRRPGRRADRPCRRRRSALADLGAARGPRT